MANDRRDDKRGTASELLFHLVSGLKPSRSEAAKIRTLGSAERVRSFGRSIVPATKILGTTDARDRLFDDAFRTSEPIDFTKSATRLKRRDVVLSARRQQREGMGTGAQSAAVRRSLAMAKGRMGGTLGASDDPGRKSVLGGGI